MDRAPVVPRKGRVCGKRARIWALIRKKPTFTARGVELIAEVKLSLVRDLLGYWMRHGYVKRVRKEGRESVYTVVDAKRLTHPTVCEKCGRKITEPCLESLNGGDGD